MTVRALRSLLFAAMAVLAAACGGAPEQPAAEAACRSHTFDGDDFLVCAFDPKTHDLRLVSAGADGAPLRAFSALETSLGPDAARVRFAMNAGMFDDQGRAIGLLIEQGRELHAASTSDGPGNFHMKPNGVFSLDRSGARVEDTETYLRRGGQPTWATQSGPMLVIAGALHPAIDFDGASLNVRNGVGVRDDGVAFFVISQKPVSFGRLARLFRDQLDCMNALYLDGVVSGAWVPSLKRMDAGAPLGPLAVVLDKPPAE